MKRRDLVKLLESHFGVKPRYLGMPSGNYLLETDNQVYTIDIQGKIVNGSGETVELETLLSSGSQAGVGVNVEEQASELVSGVKTSEEVASGEQVIIPEVVSEEVSEPSNAPLEAVSDSVSEETVSREEVSGEEVSGEEVPEANSGSLGVSNELTAESEKLTVSDGVSEEESTVPSEASLGVTDSPEEDEPTANPEELTAYDVSIPFGDHTGNSLRNMLNMIYSKQSLIMKSFGVSNHIVKALLIEALNTEQPHSLDRFKAILTSTGTDYCPGINFDFDKEVICFNFLKPGASPDELQAFIDFITLLNQTALSLKYASSKVSDTDNERFTFRVWLIRLGMNGSQYKTTRKILLQNLEGDPSFRYGKPDKAKEE